VDLSIVGVIAAAGHGFSSDFADVEKGWNGMRLRDEGRG